MHSAILVHPRFEAVWPWTADHARGIWDQQGTVEFLRVDNEETRPVTQLLTTAAKVERLLVLGYNLTVEDAERLPGLREFSWIEGGYGLDENRQAAVLATLRERGVRLIRHHSEGYWGQSVAEFGFALTLCGLRRIPQLHRETITNPQAWYYNPPEGVGRPASRGQQFGDDDRFTNGTLEGKRVRIVGVGNIASRYASFCHFFGANVAAWDPFANEPCFHRSGARREHFLERLVRDAEIFAPMVPLTDRTRGLITVAHIDALPRGTLVVLVTRADICDMAALRRRVLAGELSLAADVFDVEPLPPNDPLLGHPNVVHTPHNAGRTKQANERWVDMLLAQYAPV